LILGDTNQLVHFRPCENTPISSPVEVAIRLYGSIRRETRYAGHARPSLIRSRRPFTTGSPESSGADYRLDDEQRDRVRRCLTKEDIALRPDGFTQLVRDIEASIDHFQRSAAGEGTPHEAHNALRALSRRSRLKKPPIQVLREELQKLPREAIEYMARRARGVIPRLVPGTYGEKCGFDPPERFVAQFLEWVDTADDEKFVEAVRVLSSEGGRVVLGRSRGDGKRSPPQAEPVIMGVARGAGSPGLRDGAPIKAAQHELVMSLALQWLHATGKAPKPGRSDNRGFGDLVHSVFQWLDVSGDSSETAAYALHRYWSTVQRRKKRAVPSTVLPICADCRRVRVGAARDEFFCEKLNLQCSTARNPGQECGSEGLLFELGQI
jgi:hypothetical protein